MISSSTSKFFLSPSVWMGCAGCLRFIASLIANFCFYIKVLFRRGRPSNQNEFKSNHVAGRTTTSRKCQVQKHSNLSPPSPSLDVSQRKKRNFSKSTRRTFFFLFLEKGSRTCVDLAMRHRPKWRNRKQELGRGRRWWRGQQTQLELPASQTFSFNETNKSLWGSFPSLPPYLTPLYSTHLPLFVGLSFPGEIKSFCKLHL